ncbi:MAG: peptidoglycan DD-metalloendopeptidase family protein [Cytophagales bacterium]|nr:peptidoglycan DD-metalloendopeptidase family protein [Cytophagales bacterium]
MLKPTKIVFSSAFCRLLAACLLLVASFVPVFGQRTRAQLEREKRQNLARIAETNRILQETGAEKTATLGQLSALQEQIATRQGLINKITEEMALLDREINSNGQMLWNMETEYASLQREYAAMVYATSKNTASYNKLLFLFSAGSFTEMFMRMKYLQQYSESRKQQIKQLEAAREALAQQRVALDKKKQEKRVLLASQISENKNLLALKQKQNQMVERLSQKENELSAELAERRESVQKLENLIAAVIAEEVRRAAERERAERERREALASARKGAAARKPAAVRAAPEASTSAAASTASSFEASRSQLAWPVSSGFIAGHFGRQSHPIIKTAYIDNHGVDIQTNRGEEVRAVYEGEVAAITDVPGMHKLVMIKHDQDYFTVYVKLGKVTVARGQKVKAKQVIGEVYTDSEGTSQLQFQIWRNQEKLNPENWLLDK